MAEVAIVGGPLAGLVVPIGDKAFHIGRQASVNDLELPDASISRRHCVIEAFAAGHGARFRIRDLGSANGLRINGQSTTEAHLRSGDRIQLGDSVLLFEECDDVFSVPDTGAEMEATVVSAQQSSRTFLPSPRQDICRRRTDIPTIYRLFLRSRRNAIASTRCRQYRVFFLEGSLKEFRRSMRPPFR